jgi:tyrosyl-tRNA synthetase
MKQLLPELAWRGLIQDQTPGLENRLTTGPTTGYAGFDPTAQSLQIGNLVPVMLLAHLQRAGGTPIVIVGGATGMIGDPSGTSAERPLLTVEEIDHNASRQRDQLSRFMDFERGDNRARMLNNAQWLRPQRLLDFLRDVGKHFTISYMTQKESVKSRLESGISYTEFSYMLLQAYDFLHLYRQERCELQVGGSDQWGNITAGTELIRRTEGAEAHGLSAPLVTMASGAKFGKTAGGAVWLDPAMTSPYTFYQFWINSDDRDVERYLKIFTFKRQGDIARLMGEQAEDPGRRTAHRALAQDLTNRIHGEDVTRRVEAASEVFFNAQNRELLHAASREVWETLESELPHWKTSASRFPFPIVDLAAESGLTSSKGDARRQLQQGAISVNGRKVDIDATVGASDLLAGQFVWLRRGKKMDVIVRVDGVSS